MKTKIKHDEVEISLAQTREDERAQLSGCEPFCIKTMEDIVYCEHPNRMDAYRAIVFRQPSVTPIGLGEALRTDATDGATRIATMEDIRPGVVLRSFDLKGRTYPFGDIVVTKTYESPTGSPVFDAVRPYAFEHLGGHLMNAEPIGHIGENTLKSGHYRVVLTSRGVPYTHSLSRP